MLGRMHGAQKSPELKSGLDVGGGRTRWNLTSKSTLTPAGWNSCIHHHDCRLLTGFIRQMLLCSLIHMRDG